MQGPRHFARLTVKIQLDVGVQEDGDHGEEEHLQLWSPARKWWMVVHLALSWSCHAARISWEVETTGKVYLLHIWTKCVNSVLIYHELPARTYLCKGAKISYD